MKGFIRNIFLFSLLAMVGIGCSNTTQQEPNSLEITQTVIVMAQTQTAMAGSQGQSLVTVNGTSIPEVLIPTLTKQAELLENLTETQTAAIFSQTQLASTILLTDTPFPTKTPFPTYTPKPLSPSFTTSETMFCRQGPDTFYEAHYTLGEGKTVPVLAKWVNNDWLLVSINDESTRTKCCWVGGEGNLNVSLSTLKSINFLPDRIACDLTP